MAVMRKLSILAAVAAVMIGVVTQRLPEIIRALVKSDRESVGLQRLRIGHAMAGGGEAGSVAMADSIKTIFLSKIFGVKTTSSRLAWRELVRALAEAEQMYLSPSWGFGLGPPEFAANEIAEGLRYVSHVTKLALDVYLEETPRFVRMVSPTLKILGDNPDAIYHIASLRANTYAGVGDAHNFEIRGCRGPNEIYFSFSIHAPSLTGGAFERVVTDISDNDITFESNGCYRLILSSKNPGEVALDGATWLRMPQEASSLVTRHYFESWPPAALHENVQLSISQWPPEGSSKPAVVSDRVIAERIGLATDFLQRHTMRMPQPDPTTAPPFFSLLPNKIGIPQKWSADSEGMGAVDIAYAAGRFLLKEGQALIIQGSVPHCRFANVVLWNRFLQTFDYTAYDEWPVFYTLERPIGDERDRAFSIVLSGSNPISDKQRSAPFHWLFTEGRETGTIFFRFLLPEGEEYPSITTHVVPAEQVLSFFSGNN